MHAVSWIRLCNAWLLSPHTLLCFLAHLSVSFEVNCRQNTNTQSGSLTIALPLDLRYHHSAGLFWTVSKTITVCYQSKGNLSSRSHIHQKKILINEQRPRSPNFPYLGSPSSPIDSFHHSHLLFLFSLSPAFLFVVYVSSCLVQFCTLRIEPVRVIYLWTDIACSCKISSTQALYCREVLVCSLVWCTAMIYFISTLDR